MEGVVGTSELWNNAGKGVFFRIDNEENASLDSSHEATSYLSTYSMCRSKVFHSVMMAQRA